MLFVWRGWGFLALAVLLLPLASCGGLIDYSATAAGAAFGATLIGGGLVCLLCGRRWNAGSRFHSMYWLSLEFWGWAYIALGGLLVAMIAIGLARKALSG